MYRTPVISSGRRSQSSFAFRAAAGRVDEERMEMLQRNLWAVPGARRKGLALLLLVVGVVAVMAGTTTGSASAVGTITIGVVT